ncbi:Lateral organ boundaries, LOB [Dillenia turbinata]|uniref:Lateral organ boundaries, LOB n=1 Tax=Dillenia turbinata TaxID=194707 RepID=A0AAN8VKD0_9MAGN
MRMSCNGCRVLRKGCSEDCAIKPCLQWIKDPEFQANATLFLAKYYGRAGLVNLINAGPQHLRPAIFRSLLYEACGRIISPIYGSVGLLWSNNWHRCQAAVESVLKGTPIMPISTESPQKNPKPPLKFYDIRHMSKVLKQANANLHKRRTRRRFKRNPPGNHIEPARPESFIDFTSGVSVCRSEKNCDIKWPSQCHQEVELLNESGKTENGSKLESESHDGEVELELALGF